MNARTIVAASMGNVKIASLALALPTPPREAVGLSVVRDHAMTIAEYVILGILIAAPVVSAGLAFSGRKF